MHIAGWIKSKDLDEEEWQYQVEKSYTSIVRSWMGDGWLNLTSLVWILAIDELTHRQLRFDFVESIRSALSVVVAFVDDEIKKDHLNIVNPQTRMTYNRSIDLRSETSFELINAAVSKNNFIQWCNDMGRRLPLILGRASGLSYIEPPIHTVYDGATNKRTELKPVNKRTGLQPKIFFKEEYTLRCRFYRDGLKNWSKLKPFPSAKLPLERLQEPSELLGYWGIVEFYEQCYLNPPTALTDNVSLVPKVEISIERADVIGV